MQPQVGHLPRSPGERYRDDVAAPLVLFPCDPSRPRTPDGAFEREAAAARAAGLRVGVLDHDAAAAGDAHAAVRGVPEGPGLVVYRGWMLRPERYALVHDALVACGAQPLTDAAAYRAAHHLPAWYPALQTITPRSVWVEGDLAPARIVEAARAFGDAPLVVKDFVKSEKHLWKEACFVPRASDLSALLRVVTRFLEERGPDLEGGLVLREFVALELLGEHPRSRMPIAVEARVFVLDGRPVHVLPYWEGTSARVPSPPLDQFAQALGRVPSRFFTADVARRTDGEWIVLEVGDGQVSGLPEDADPAPLYGGLAARLA